MFVCPLQESDMQIHLCFPTTKIFEIDINKSTLIKEIGKTNGYEIYDIGDWDLLGIFFFVFASKIRLS